MSSGAGATSASTTPPTRSTTSPGARSATGISNSPSRCCNGDGRRRRATRRARPPPGCWASCCTCSTRSCRSSPRSCGRSCELGDGLLMPAAWPSISARVEDPGAKAEMDWVVQAITEIRALRSEMNVPAGARLVLGYKDASPAAVARLEQHADIIRTLARLERIEDGQGRPRAAPCRSSSPEATLVLPLAGVIDVGGGARPPGQGDRQARRRDRQDRQEAVQPGVPRQGRPRGRRGPARAPRRVRGGADAAGDGARAPGGAVSR